MAFPARGRTFLFVSTRSTTMIEALERFKEALTEASINGLLTLFSCPSVFAQNHKDHSTFLIVTKVSLKRAVVTAEVSGVSSHSRPLNESHH